MFGPGPGEPLVPDELVVRFSGEPFGARPDEDFLPGEAEERPAVATPLAVKEDVADRAASRASASLHALRRTYLPPEVLIRSFSVGDPGRAGSRARRRLPCRAPPRRRSRRRSPCGRPWSPRMTPRPRRRISPSAREVHLHSGGRKCDRAPALSVRNSKPSHGRRLREAVALEDRDAEGVEELGQLRARGSCRERKKRRRPPEPSLTFRVDEPVGEEPASAATGFGGRPPGARRRDASDATPSAQPEDKPPSARRPTRGPGRGSSRGPSGSRRDDARRSGLAVARFSAKRVDAAVRSRRETEARTPQHHAGSFRSVRDGTQRNWRSKGPQDAQRADRSRRGGARSHGSARRPWDGPAFPRCK